MSRFMVAYDFGDSTGVTGWILYKDGIYLSKHESWAEARDRRNELEQAVAA